eukprot:TRINITY_DN2873_c0_g5_i1.p1 TRINITY_DN2873_c0_g5~~TRINITY_DN2873_c0_g5_i1.p1  ORF type:complete len:825 (+),score=318.90 TRINITY_DN2873_c0_g5_i1:115-2589(+)
MKFAVITAGSVGLLIVVVVLSLVIPVSERMTDALVEARRNEMASISKEVAEQFVDYFTEATRAAEMMENFWENSLRAAPDAPMHYLIETYSLAIFNFLMTRKGLGACYIAMEREHGVADGQDCDVDGMLLSTTFRAVFTNETTGMYDECPHHMDDPEGFAKNPQRSCKGFARLCALRGAKDMANPLTPVARIFDQPCKRWILGSTFSLNSKQLSRDAGPDPANPKHNLQGPAWAWSWPFVAGANSKSQAVKHGSFRPLRPTGRETKMVPLAFCDLTMSKSTVNQEGFQSLGDILTSTIKSMEDKSTGTVLFVLSHKQEFVATSLEEVVPERIEGSTTDPLQASITGLKKYDNETLPASIRQVGEWVMSRSCPDGQIPCNFDTLPNEGMAAGHYLTMRPLHDPLADQLGMLLIMMVPEAEVKQPAKDAQTELVIIGVCVFVAAVIASVGFGIVVSMPIKNVRVLLLGAAALEDLDEIVEQTHNKSAVSEIADMQGSLRVLVKALIMYKGFLPQSLVENDDDEESAAEESVTQSKMTASRDSRKQSKTGSKSQSLSRSTLQIGARATLSCLQRKKVSFSLVNLCGWHDTIRRDTDRDVLKEHGSYVATTLNVFQQARGVADSFAGDRMLCSFNAARQLGGHKQACVEALINVVRVVTEECGVKLSCAAVTGDARVGNMGCNVMKKYTFISAAVPWVFVLERYANAMGVSTLSDQFVEEAAKNAFEHRAVFQLQYQKRAAQPIKVFEVGEKLDVEEDEWMYQLEGAEAKDRNGPWNKWADAVMQRDWATAETHYEKAKARDADSGVFHQLNNAYSTQTYTPFEVTLH